MKAMEKRLGKTASNLFLVGFILVLALIGLKFIVIDVLSPVFSFLRGIYADGINFRDSIDVFILLVVVLLVLLCVYFIVRTKSEAKENKDKWDNKFKTMEEDNARLQEMLKDSGEMIKRAEKVEKEKKEEYEKARNLTQEAESMLDELKQRK